jgi:cardiolipin synthase
VVIDGVWSTVGSTNLDWRSFLHNHELNAVVLGAEFGAQMRAAFERDRAGSTEIRLPQWQQRSLADRLKQGFARLWEYWL